MRDVLIAGDTLDFTTSVPNYPPSAGFTLKYRLIPRTSGTAITITAATSGDDYRVQVSPATTANWTAGEYTWHCWAEKSGARYTVGQPGTCTIKPDPGVVAAYDGRTHARKALDAIEAVLENRATLDQEEYAINGRSLKRTPVLDLIRMRSFYKNEVRAEDAAARLAAGLGGAPKVQVRL